MISIKPKKKKIPLTPYLMLLPTLIIFGCFVFYPFIRTIYLSFFLTDAAGLPMKFYSTKHYQWLFDNKYFWNSVQTTIKFAVLVGVPTFIFGFILALMANSRMKGSRLYETLYSLPMALKAGMLRQIREMSQYMVDRIEAGRLAKAQ